MDNMFLWVEQLVIKRLDDESIGVVSGEYKLLDAIDWQKFIESDLGVEVAESFGGEKYPCLKLPSVVVDDQAFGVEAFVFGFCPFLWGFLFLRRLFVLFEGHHTAYHCVFLNDVDDVLLAEGLDQIIEIYLFLLDGFHHCDFDAVYFVSSTESLDYAVTADLALSVFG